MAPGFIIEDIALRRSANRYISANSPPPSGPSPLIRPFLWPSPLLTLCAGLPTDLRTDNDHCGGCGIQCEPDTVCCNAVCVPRSQNCGGCGSDFACVPPLQCCQDLDGAGQYRCIDIFGSDTDNCGACNRPAYATQSLLTGQFIAGCCENGQPLRPTDFLSDPKHCGTCENDCTVRFGGNASCSSGHCCPPCHFYYPGTRGGIGWGAIIAGLLGTLVDYSAGGLSAYEIILNKLEGADLSEGCHPCSEARKFGTLLGCCDGRNCMSLESDNDNCGACGKSCFASRLPNQQCVNGVCLCPPDKPNPCPISGACVDLLRNHENCGVCGRACGADETCCNGRCTDVTSDAFNCGECGNYCWGVIDNFIEGSSTSVGCCSGKCTEYCGRCGIECAPSETCLDGVCQPSPPPIL
jgi:hypothetical protein